MLWIILMNLHTFSKNSGISYFGVKKGKIRILETKKLRIRADLDYLL